MSELRPGRFQIGGERAGGNLFENAQRGYRRWQSRIKICASLTLIFDEFAG